MAPRSAPGAAPSAWCWAPRGLGRAQRTKETCDALVKIDAARGFGSLNVSNAAAVGLYAARAHM